MTFSNLISNWRFSSNLDLPFYRLDTSNYRRIVRFTFNPPDEELPDGEIGLEPILVFPPPEYLDRFASQFEFVDCHRPSPCQAEAP